MQQKRGDEPEQVKNKFGSKFNSSGNSQKTKLAVLVLGAIIAPVLIMQQFFLPNYVNKADDIKNIKGLGDRITDVSNNTVQSLGAMQNTMNALPTSISAQVSKQVETSTNGMTSRIASLESQSNNIASLVKGLQEQSGTLSNRIQTNSTNIQALSANVSGLSGVNAGLLIVSGNISALSQRIADLEARMATIQTQSNLLSLVVSGESANWSVVNGAAGIASLTITNSSNVTMAAPVELVITIPNGLSSVSATSSFPSSVISYPSGQIKLTTSVNVLPNSTAIMNVNVTITYTGTPTGVWSYAWRKQI